MEAFRKIVTIKDNVLRVVLPDQYNNTQVELIILPAGTEDVTTQVQDSKTDYYAKFYGTMKSNLSQEELDKKLNALREEWKRDTF
ncbi:MAG: hypothetical protein ABIR06_00720 [Cyclobacteriaceae bacterium]